jgi:hypothetical protein
MQEYKDFRRKYSFVCFNDNSANRKGNVLLCYEPYNINPNNYDIKFIKEYRHVVTWNPWFYEKCIEFKVPVTRITGAPCFNRYHYISHETPFEKKIKGICMIGNHRAGKREGDIAHLRYEVVRGIYDTGKMIGHCYGKKAYGGDMYKGIIGEGSEFAPSSKTKLEVINSYKFHLCFENCYHEKWSQGYITEKILDCFRAKTVAVYKGCYDIEKHIDSSLFVDYRKFKNSKDLTLYLVTMGPAKYNKIVKDAYDFEQKCRIGNIEDLSSVFDKLRV